MFILFGFLLFFGASYHLGAVDFQDGKPVFNAGAYTDGVYRDGTPIPDWVNEDLNEFEADG